MRRDDKKPIAEWSVSLDVDCPHCDSFVDLCDNPDFPDCGIRVFEKSDEHEAVCPECQKEFICKIA